MSIAPKGSNITYCEYMSVALVNQNAKRMRSIVYSSVTCLALPYFSTLFHKLNDFQKKKFLVIKCVSIFSTKFI